ncbi:MAG: hypothetical protein JST62_01050 [Bacteroidetes bacterium]|nr:hypothetical protein [Bacteroidota bacterium]
MFKRWFKRSDGKKTLFAKITNTIRDVATFTPIGGTVDKFIQLLGGDAKK